MQRAARKGASTHEIDDKEVSSSGSGDTRLIKRRDNHYQDEVETVSKNRLLGRDHKMNNLVVFEGEHFMNARGGLLESSEENNKFLTQIRPDVEHSQEQEEEYSIHQSIGEEEPMQAVRQKSPDFVKSRTRGQNKPITIHDQKRHDHNIMRDGSNSSYYNHATTGQLHLQEGLHQNKINKDVGDHDGVSKQPDDDGHQLLSLTVGSGVGVSFQAFLLALGAVCLSWTILRRIRFGCITDGTPHDPPMDN